MQVIHSVRELRQRLAGEGAVGLVPTMGSLHAGHLQLVREARSLASCVVTSIFVNRLQFGAGEDFDRYPRGLAADVEQLASVGCQVVFAPDEREMYPQPQRVFVEPSALQHELEGAVRPGHFRGVCTVVMKLFQMVQPQVALFGKKDYQQWLILKEMVDGLGLPIQMVPGETVRAPDGLALSSRNAYLTAAERAEAPQLQAALRALASASQAIPAAASNGSETARRETRGRAPASGQAAQQGSQRQDPERLDALCENARQALQARGWSVDYLTVRRQSDLQPLGPGDREAVALAAARLGQTRLIDNLEFRTTERLHGQ